MTTTFYLLRDEVPLPHPTTKQSADTITYDCAILYATYAKPGYLSLNRGSQDTITASNPIEPGYPNYNHFGTFVSDPLPTQVLSGTVTISLVMLETVATLNAYPRVKIYLWKADNTFGGDILALTTSATECKLFEEYGYATCEYFVDEPITETVINKGDKIVIEIETYNNNTLNLPTTRYFRSIQYGGSADGHYNSFITFSDDLVTTIDEKPPVASTPTIDVNIYDQSMNLIGIIDDYEYLRWTRNWYSADTWEMRINRYKTNADLILTSRSLSGTTWEYGGFIGVTTALGRRVGMIDRIELPLDPDGKVSEQYLISGKGVEGVLGTRLAMFGTDTGDGFDTQNTYGETAMRHYVQVNAADEAGTAPHASFTASPTSGALPLYVDFINTSSGTAPLTYSWDYTNNGSEDSTDQSPTDISYNTAGSFTCKLTVTNDYGVSTAYRTITVSEAEGAPVAAFYAGVTSGMNPLEVTFIDQSTETPTSWLWNFGDGSTSTSQNPTHTYTSTGSFTVSLVATNAAGSDTETKTNYITVTTSSGIPEYGAPTILNGYYLGGSLSYTIDGVTFGGGTQYPVYTAGVAGGGYDGSTISTRTALLAALAAATSGAVIYLSPTADIVLNEAADEAIEIPAGVTIASNRGVSGSTGGKISTTKAGSGWGTSLFKTAGNNVRLTGLRLEGECFAENYGGYEYDPYPAPIGFEEMRIGLLIYGHTGCVVDNCDLKGFGYACVYTYNCPTSGRPHIHHNYIHHCQNAGMGYGVNCGDGDVLVEGNVFHRNRHDMTGDGAEGELYTFRYNYVTAALCEIQGQAHVDIHGRGETEQYSGDRYDVYNNTFAGGQELCVHQRGYPAVGCYVHHNLLNGDSSHTGFDGSPVAQDGYPDIGHMYVTYNYFGETLYTDDEICQYVENE